jgi:hypothetical protein
MDNELAGFRLLPKRAGKNREPSTDPPASDCDSTTRKDKCSNKFEFRAPPDLVGRVPIVLDTNLTLMLVLTNITILLSE